MNRLDERSLRLGFWLALLGSVFAWAPATYPGYWQSLDGFIPIWNAPQQSALANIATWPDLWRGTGRGAFLLVQPLILLGATPAAAVRAVMIIAILLGGLGCYAWLRPRLGDRGAGLAALVYMTLPIVLNTVYLRGSLADTLLLGLLPVALAGLASYTEHRTPSAAAMVVLSLLWMWRIQAGMAVFITLLLLVYALWVERSRLATLVVGVSAAAALVTLIPLWGVASPAPVTFADHLLHPAQWLYRLVDFPPTAPDRSLGMPVFLGFSALVLGAAALWLWTRNPIGRVPADLNRLLTFAVVGSVVLLLLTVHAAAPLWSLSGGQRLLTYPWQLLALTAPLLAALVGSLPALNLQLARAPLFVVLVGLVLLSSAPYRLPDTTQTVPARPPRSVLGSRPDLAVMQAEVTTDVATGAARLDVTWQVLQTPRFDYNIFFQAVVPAGPNGSAGDHVVAQLDAQPRQGLAPATTWVPGTVMTDTFRLEFNDELTPDERATLRYYFGFYDWRDGARLPVDGGIDDKMILHGQ